MPQQEPAILQAQGIEPLGQLGPDANGTLLRRFTQAAFRVLGPRGSP